MCKSSVKKTKKRKKSVVLLLVVLKDRQKRRRSLRFWLGLQTAGLCFLAYHILATSYPAKCCNQHKSLCDNHLISDLFRLKHLLKRCGLSRTLLSTAILWLSLPELRNMGGKNISELEVNPHDKVEKQRQAVVLFGSLESGIEGK